MNPTQSTIIRNGNHFILLEGAGWVLIDGPWFDFLNRFSGRCIEMPRLPHLDLWKATPTLWLGGTLFEKVSWERVKWFPGTDLKKGAVEAAFGPWLHDLWERWSTSRCRYGWRMLPDGPLPTSLDKAEYDDPLGLQIIEYEKKVWYESDPIHDA